MPAYFVAELDTTNQAGMDPYRAAVPATITQYGGRYLTRGGATELIEGGPEPNVAFQREIVDRAVLSVKDAGSWAIVARASSTRFLLQICGAVHTSRRLARLSCDRDDRPSGLYW